MNIKTFYPFARHDDDGGGGGVCFGLESFDTGWSQLIYSSFNGVRRGGDNITMLLLCV